MQRQSIKIPAITLFFALFGHAAMANQCANIDAYNRYPVMIELPPAHNPPYYVCCTPGSSVSNPNSTCIAGNLPPASGPGSPVVPQPPADLPGNILPIPVYGIVLPPVSPVVTAPTGSSPTGLPTFPLPTLKRCEAFYVGGTKTCTALYYLNGVSGSSSKQFFNVASASECRTRASTWTDSTNVTYSGLNCPVTDYTVNSGGSAPVATTAPVAATPVAPVATTPVNTAPVNAPVATAPVQPASSTPDANAGNAAAAYARCTANYNATARSCHIQYYTASGILASSVPMSNVASAVICGRMGVNSMTCAVTDVTPAPAGPVVSDCRFDYNAATGWCTGGWKADSVAKAWNYSSVTSIEGCRQQALTGSKAASCSVTDTTPPYTVKDCKSDYKASTNSCTGNYILGRTDSENIAVSRTLAGIKNNGDCRDAMKTWTDSQYGALSINKCK